MKKKKKMSILFINNVKFINKACAYLADKIYCYGGSPATSENNIDYLSMLDISSYVGSTASELENKWVTVNTAETSINMEHRTNQQSMQLSDGKNLLISGGLTLYTKPALKDQTIVFNADTLSWEAYPNYEEPPFGNRQM